MNGSFRPINGICARSGFSTENLNNAKPAAHLLQAADNGAERFGIERQLYLLNATLAIKKQRPVWAPHEVSREEVKLEFYAKGDFKVIAGPNFK
jgi:hypothetical protein